MSAEPAQEQPQVEQMAVEESATTTAAAPAATPAADQAPSSQGMWIFGILQTLATLSKYSQAKLDSISY